MPSDTASGTGPSVSGASSELTEVELLMRLARRWRSLGVQEQGGQGLSPHQERGLLTLARLTRRAEQDGDAAEHLSHESAEHHSHESAKHHSQGSAKPHSGVRVSHLAEHLGIAPRSATEVADSLESAGLLTRSPDPTDRRAVLLTLTDEGRHTVAAVRDRRRAAAEDAVATLSPADRTELRRLLETLLTQG